MASAAGRTCWSNIALASRGTPGTTKTRQSPTSAATPPAVPTGLSSRSAPSGVPACLRFASGIVLPRLAQICRIRSIQASLKTTGRPTTAARASRVKSSGVGPMPPLTSNRSLPWASRLMAASMAISSSDTLACSTTRTPAAASSCANQAVFVSTVSPLTISSPTLRTRATGALRADIASRLAPPPDSPEGPSETGRPRRAISSRTHDPRC